MKSDRFSNLLVYVFYNPQGDDLHRQSRNKYQAKRQGAHSKVLKRLARMLSHPLLGQPTGHSQGAARRYSAGFEAIRR